ncbi:MAG TPA: hypothetical protein VGN88_02260 [Phycisphaerae bacterium]|jgi:hypothetical protein
MKFCRLTCGLLAALTFSLATPAVHAGGFGGGGFGGGRGGGGGGFGGGANGGFQINIRQIVLGRIQDTISSPDDEWSVIEPKLWKVVSLQIASGSGQIGQLAGALRRGRGGGAGGGGFDLNAVIAQQTDPQIAQLGTDLQTKQNELSDAADDPQSGDGQLQARLDEYRAAKQKLDDALAQAQKDLQSVLTLRQEALLMEQGFLD